jgi:arylsulfatase A-like enzyme
MMRNKRRVAVVNVVSIALAVFCSMPVAGLAVNSARPNVVLFFLDDMGYGDSRVYNPKSTIEMPHFEKLAANGMIFTDGHSTTAVCAPSRYSVLTGNYPWRGRSTLGTWGFNEPPQILDGQRTLGNLMQDMGYRTAIFGKLHLGGLYPRKGSTNDWIIGTDTQTSHGREPAWQEIDFSQRFRRGPLDWGFDYSYVLPSGIQHEPYAFFENDRLVDDPGKLVLWPQGAYGKDTWFSHEGFGSPDWTTSAAGPKLTEKAVAFIERKADAPFFIHYCSQSLHEPWYPPLEFRGKKIRGQSVSWQTDMLLEFDQTLGAFIEALEKQGQLSNTLFIITSDNGGWPFPDTVKKGHNPNEGLRGRKGDAWEAGHRVPFVVAWGDGEHPELPIPAGARSDQLVGIQDIYATLAELVGVPVRKGQAVDSISFLPALKGHSAERVSMVMQGGDLHDYRRCVREGNWKLMVTSTGEPEMLFDLEVDLMESNNLIHQPEQQERVRRMLQIYRDSQAPPIHLDTLIREKVRPAGGIDE